MANGYFGKLYASSQTSIRFDFPFRIPFYIEPEITFNRWNFYKSSNLFFEDVKPRKRALGAVDANAPSKPPSSSSASQRITRRECEPKAEIARAIPD